uniref:Uncharacterized protein n=1 Tax=Pipistrellus kuhlii TaxID=59472 RepID=A0A7J7Y992_PIPKU|nr:hypothetical protein mPipKuh1_010328 [Pipistrellus kuhlii]
MFIYKWSRNALNCVQNYLHCRLHHLGHLPPLPLRHHHLYHHLHNYQYHHLCPPPPSPQSPLSSYGTFQSHPPALSQPPIQDTHFLSDFFFCLFVLSTLLLFITTRSSRLILYASFPSSRISPGFFTLRIVWETKIWALVKFIALWISFF